MSPGTWPRGPGKDRPPRRPGRQSTTAWVLPSSPHLPGFSGRLGSRQGSSGDCICTTTGSEWWLISRVHLTRPGGAQCWARHHSWAGPASPWGLEERKVPPSLPEVWGGLWGPARGQPGTRAPGVSSLRTAGHRPDQPSPRSNCTDAATRPTSLDSTRQVVFKSCQHQSLTGRQQAVTVTRKGDTLSHGKGTCYYTERGHAITRKGDTPSHGKGTHCYVEGDALLQRSVWVPGLPPPPATRCSPGPRLGCAAAASGLEEPALLESAHRRKGHHCPQSSGPTVTKNTAAEGILQREGSSRQPCSWNVAGEPPQPDARPQGRTGAALSPQQVHVTQARWNTRLPCFVSSFPFSLIKYRI